MGSGRIFGYMSDSTDWSRSDALRAFTTTNGKGAYVVVATSCPGNGIECRASSHRHATRAAGWREGAHPSTLPESFLSYVDTAKQCRCLRQYILKVLDGTGESPLCSSTAPRSGYVPFMFPKQTR
jgi:hypothetical protein